MICQTEDDRLEGTGEEGIRAAVHKVNTAERRATGEGVGMPGLNLAAPSEDGAGDPRPCARVWVRHACPRPIAGQKDTRSYMAHELPRYALALLSTVKPTHCTPVRRPRHAHAQSAVADFNASCLHTQRNLRPFQHGVPMPAVSESHSLNVLSSNSHARDAPARSTRRSSTRCRRYVLSLAY